MAKLRAGGCRNEEALKKALSSWNQREPDTTQGEHDDQEA